MRAEIDQNGLDDDKQGYARVVVDMDQGDPSLADTDSIAIGIYTANGLEFLQPAGGDAWTGAPKRLALDATPVINGATGEFLLQPAYVDSLQDGNYEVYLLDKGGNVKGKASAPFYDIVYSPLRGSNAVRSQEEEPEPDTDADETGQTGAGGQTGGSAPQPPAETKDEESDTELPSAPESGEDSQPPDQPESGQQASSETPQPAPARKSGAGLWVAIGLIALILACGAGGGYYYFSKKKPAEETAQAPVVEEPQQTPDAKQAEEAAAKAAADQKAAQEAEAAAKAAAEKKAAQEAEREQASPRGRVAQFFAGPRDPAAAMALAKELKPQSSEDQDAVFRLYYYAAENGDPDGAVAYAEAVDPSLPPFGTAQKNAAEAYYYYGKSPNGKEAQAKVKAWTEERAKTGNKAARGWLTEME